MTLLLGRLSELKLRQLRLPKLKLRGIGRMISIRLMMRVCLGQNLLVLTPITMSALPRNSLAS